MEDIQRHMTLTFQLYMTFTLPHQQMFIDISNFADFCLSVQRALSCLLSLVSRLLSPVSCLLSLVSCLPSSVSHAVSAADLIYNNIADLAILWSKFVDLGNLAILTLLADLAD